MSITAMKQALEALENSVDLAQNEYAVAVELYDKYPTRAAKIDGLLALQKAHEDSITALRQAIEQAEEAKPVGQLLEDAFGRGQVMWFNKPSDESMLYTHPPTAPAQQPLTDEDIQTLINKADKEWHEDEVTDEWAERFARAVEAHIKGASL